MIDDRAYLVALRRFPQFGAKRLVRLARHFPTFKRAFEASATDLVEAGIEANLASRFLQERIHLYPEQEWDLLLRHGVELLTISDERYPPLLKQIFDPPAVLFYRGTLPDWGRKHLAVVGSRKATDYGIRVTEDLVGPLARHGTVIVSGLAYGIDAAAHQQTIDVGGTTLAILGSGVDEESIYPSQHRTLVSRILSSGGAIISEFPIGTPPLKQHFPFRNRVIAGLCHGTLVVEAAIKSGSLITAQSALSANRDVYAVPGSIHAPMSEGPLQLIKDGATPVTSTTDILGYEAVEPANSPAVYKPTSDEEALILKQLTHTPRHIDEIVQAVSLPTSTVLSLMSLMEMKGGVRQEQGQFYARAA